MAEKHQKKKKGSTLKILLAVLLLLVLTVGAAGVFAYNEINGNGGKPGAEVTVSIPQGSSLRAIPRPITPSASPRPAMAIRRRPPLRPRETEFIFVEELEPVGGTGSERR